MTMLKPFRMPDGSILFVGREAVFQTPGKIDPHDIVQYEFEVSAMPDQISPAVEKVMDCIQQFPFQKDKLVDFEIAISEAVQNSVLHDGEDPERKVGIHILYIPKIALLVGVTDDLGPLNIEELKLDVVDENGLPSLAEGGRGLFIMSSLCSIVAYVPDVPHGRMKQFILALVPESQGK